MERVHKTLQDRLVKELRLAGVSDMDAANAFAPAFIVDFNRRFARAPRVEKDLHRQLRPQDDLDSAFTWQAQRKVSKNLTLQYQRILFILEPNEVTSGLPGQAGRGAGVSRWPLGDPPPGPGAALPDVRLRPPRPLLRIARSC